MCTSTEMAQLSILFPAVGALPSVVSPLLIFPRNHSKDILIKDGPTGS